MPDPTALVKFLVVPYRWQKADLEARRHTLGLYVILTVIFVVLVVTVIVMLLAKDWRGRVTEVLVWGGVGLGVLLLAWIVSLFIDVVIGAPTRKGPPSVTPTAPPRIMAIGLSEAERDQLRAAVGLGPIVSTYDKQQLATFKALISELDGSNVVVARLSANSVAEWFWLGYAWAGVTPKRKLLLLQAPPDVTGGEFKDHIEPLPDVPAAALWIKASLSVPQSASG